MIKITQTTHKRKNINIMMIAMKKHNSVYNTMKPERAIQHSLVQCPIEWLPEETAHLGLRELGQQTRRIWFPEDVNGEPHESNPDDGCGGAKYKLNTIHHYDSDKNDLKSEDYDATVTYYKEALTLFHGLFNDIDYTLDNLSADKLTIWLDFQQKTDALKEPDYGAIGSLWRTIFNSDPRLEEN